MKLFNLAFTSSLGIVLLTSLISWIIFVDIENNQQQQFFKVSQLNIVDKKKQLLNHQANINAIKAFFNASTFVDGKEFSLFTNKLIGEQKVIISTLNTQLEWDFASVDEFATIKKNATVTASKNQLPQIQIPQHTVFTAELSQPENPVLVYIIPDSTLQTMLNSSESLCLKLLDENKIIKNSHCANINDTSVFAMNAYQNSVFIAISDIDQYYTIVAEQKITLQQNRDLIAMLAVIIILGFITAYMVYFRVRANKLSSQQQIENNSKLALLSSINHEIRTPINAVLGYSDMLKKTADLNQEQSKLIESVIWSANMLNSVAENTLSYSRAEAGLLKLYNTPVNLPELLARVNDNYASFQSKTTKSLLLDTENIPKEVIQLDASVFFQLTTNIINNSFKYSTGARVDCHISQTKNAHGSYIRVAVRDYGKGMGVAARNVFKKPFTTAEESNQMGGQSGIGVGLYTCKKIIDSIGGQILIRSKENQGTLVIFRFPFAASQQQQLIDPAALKGMSVYIVDDNEMNLLLCSRSLAELGMLTKTFNSEQPLLEQLSKQTPDIIVSDYQLIDTNGIKLIKKCKTYAPEAQYFILSANERDEIVADDVATDINFLKKPFNRADFVSRITPV